MGEPWKYDFMCVLQVLVNDTFLYTDVYIIIWRAGHAIPEFSCTSLNVLSVLQSFPLHCDWYQFPGVGGLDQVSWSAFFTLENWAITFWLTCDKVW